MKNYIINNAKIINEGKIAEASICIENGLISKIENHPIFKEGYTIIDASGLYLLPGLIDDQVHFREPGLTHKGNIYSESKAAVAGGITSFMEMPNTVPSAVTIDLLEEKYKIGSATSLANYSFFMGTTNTNLDELLRLDPLKVCGVKIFMGSSTGNMVVDNPASLESIFREVKMLIATHCEDDPMIKLNQQKFIEMYGDSLDATSHYLIRSEEACFKSSSFAVELAKKHNTRLHILHISTAKELSLFDNKMPSKDKRITAEACLHHLWFCNDDYATKGNFIKWNPAIKTAKDREAILQAVIDNRIDVLATDHAPHTFEEKSKTYLEAPSGGPLVQHSLVALLEMYHQNKISLEKIVEKTSHTVADLFQVEKRGYIREGYHADLVLVDLNNPWQVNKNNILYHCGWSPFEGNTFQSKVIKTFVNGHLAYDNGKFDESQKGMRLRFDR
jgi:dihydroorotase